MTANLSTSRDIPAPPSSDCWQSNWEYFTLYFYFLFKKGTVSSPFIHSYSPPSPWTCSIKCLLHGFCFSFVSVFFFVSPMKKQTNIKFTTPLSILALVVRVLFLFLSLTPLTVPHLTNILPSSSSSTISLTVCLLCFLLKRFYAFCFCSCGCLLAN